VPVLAKQFSGVFDELKSQSDFVQKVVLEEENSFLRTLATGVQRFERYAADQQVIDGEFAFELYDTFGFPIDLTELMAREKGLTVDMEGFQKALEVQKNRSRAATAIDTGDWVVVHASEEVNFVGYDSLEAEAKILKYRKVNAKGKENYQLVLDITPFYAESGGQVGDTGTLSNGMSILQITDTKKENGLIVHFTDELPEDLTATFTAQVTSEKRADTAANHSATHLLHAALKQVLGTHVNQKGSLVNNEYLRFDFSHFAKVSDEELLQVEQIVNQKIRANIALKEERNVPYKQALDSGVTALFGEKYGYFVRVITFDDTFSKELCGGIHVASTGQIGYFKFISESAVAAGVRRIEAISGTAAANFIREQDTLVQELKVALKNPTDILATLNQVLQENSNLKKEVEKASQEKALGLTADLAKQAVNINGIHFIAQKVDLPNAEAIKTLAYNLKDKLANLYVVLAAEIDGKPSLTVMLSDNLVKDKGLNAGIIIRELAKEIDGGGGGQPFYATAGGKNSAGIEKALAQAKTYIH
jgi:alanyl-tRNA synthetase